MQVPPKVAYDSYLELTSNYDVRHKILGIKALTLIVAGGNDLGTPIKCSQYLNREIEGSKLQIIPRSRHRVMVEKPEEFNQILKEFLNKTA